MSDGAVPKGGPGARKDRAEAVRQLLAGVFPSVTDERPVTLTPDNDLVHPTKRAA